MRRLANLIEAGSAALLIVDQVEDLASMHRTRVTTVLGMLKAIAARSGAAFVALSHNPAPNYPRAVTAMQNRLAQASVVFTTALMGPGGRRFLVPLRPAMSDEAPAIPFVLPPSTALRTPSSLLRRQEPRIPPLPQGEVDACSAAGQGRIPPLPRGEVDVRSAAGEGFTVAWRKPVFPAHMDALAAPRPNDGAKTRAAQTFITRALADGPRPAAEVEREAAMHGIAKRTLRRARFACNVKATRASVAGGSNGAGEWQWSLPSTSRNETE